MLLPFRDRGGVEGISYNSISFFDLETDLIPSFKELEIISLEFRLRLLVTLSFDPFDPFDPFFILFGFMGESNESSP